jgi:hypothetical protein
MFYVYCLSKLMVKVDCRSRLAATSVPLSVLEGSEDESRKDVIPLLCSIFLANQGAGDAAGEGNVVSWVSTLHNVLELYFTNVCGDACE